MSRWKAGARERLTKAAIELFAEHGFAATTVPQITERAGLTTRTFFRHFADKREVLFTYETDLNYARAAIEQAPSGLSTAAFIAWGLQLMARVRFEGLRDELRIIQQLIDSDQSLQERALRKREMLNGLIAEALLNRGLSEQQSRLLAEATVSALYSAIDRWLKTDTEMTIDALALRSLATLRDDLEGIESV